ncbi:hypothetical protein FQN57_004742 [Myotisia sp. PD_48]|nr:hypothetical protein FQN57_004742 [Myotisia sp. PD_48]
MDRNSGKRRQVSRSSHQQLHQQPPIQQHQLQHPQGQLTGSPSPSSGVFEDEFALSTASADQKLAIPRLHLPTPPKPVVPPSKQPQRNLPVTEEDDQASGENSQSGYEIDKDENSLPATVMVSTQFQYRIQRDIAEYEGCIGFLGKASTVKWMEELLGKLTEVTGVLDSDVPMTTTTTNQFLTTNTPKINDIYAECNYFRKGLGYGEFTLLAQPNHQIFLPPKATADRLVEVYFSTIHPFFPVVPAREFMLQYNSCYQNRGPPGDSLLWVSILNVMLAIGSLHAHHIQASWDGVEDHRIYWAHSRSLGQEPIPTLGAPTMEHIQLSAISALYLIASDDVNRAWFSVALGVRFAYSRALHLVNDTPGVSDKHKEFELRVWHSLCSIERLLCFLTGLPSTLQDQFIDPKLPKRGENLPMSSPRFDLGVPYNFALPSQISDRAFVASQRTTFVASLGLDGIISDALVTLYSPRTLNNTWARVQRLVAELDEKLNRWQEKWGPGFLSLSETSENTVPLLEHLYLSFRYLGARILINRPSLCDPSRLQALIPGQSIGSRRMDIEAGSRCIAAARSMVHLLPTDIDAVGFYSNFPWWCAIHYIIQAGIVLVEEISFESPYLPSGVDRTIEQATLILRWLLTLSSTNDSAHQASITFQRLLLCALRKTKRQPSMLMPDFTMDVPAGISPFNPQPMNFMPQGTWQSGRPH